MDADQSGSISFRVFLQEQNIFTDTYIIAIVTNYVLIFLNKGYVKC